MIREWNGFFALDTEHTSYGFRVLGTGQLEHLYYGRKIRMQEGCEEALFEKHAFAPGNTNLYDGEHPEFSLEDMRLRRREHDFGFRV